MVQSSSGLIGSFAMKLVAFCALLMTSINLFSLIEIELAQLAWLLVELAVGVGAADPDGAYRAGWAGRLGILAVI